MTDYKTSILALHAAWTCKLYATVHVAPPHLPAKWLESFCNGLIDGGPRSHQPHPSPYLQTKDGMHLLLWDKRRP